ncbi:MAG: hypothetical protein WCH34_01610 [Bacteroidota bacterium]
MVKIEAQNPTVRAQFDSLNNIVVGDQVKLHFSLTSPSNYNIIWHGLKDSIASKVEIVNQGKIDTVFSADKKMATYNQLLTITGFDSGSYEIPAVQFQYMKPGDTSRFDIFTQPLVLNVQTVAVDTTKAIKDIKDIAGAPLTFWEIMQWVLLGLGAALIVLAAIYVLRRIKNKQPIIKFPSKPRRPAHEIALEDLEKLRVKKLWQSGYIKEYQSELTDILRIYLHYRFEFNAMEMVSDEIIQTMRLKTDDGLLISKLHQILNIADMVKFAKANPLPSEHDTCMTIAVDIVKSTTISTSNEANEKQNLKTE